MVKAVKSKAQREREDKVYKGWWKLTGKTKQGKQIYERSPTSANIKIMAQNRIKKGAKEIKISQIPR